MKYYQLLLAITLALALCLGISSSVIAGPGLSSASGLSNGPLDTLAIKSDVGVGSGWAYSTWGGVTYSNNIYWKQPELHITQGTKSWDVFAVCVDSAHLINTGTSYTNYKVGNYSNGIPTIESQGDWNKLTYMWSKAIVITEYDRTALQLATWKGEVGDWNSSSRDNFWTSGDGNSAQFYLGDTPDACVKNKAAEFLALGYNYTGTGQVGDYKIISSDVNQNFVAAVPEPGTIFAACSILAPVGFVFRRRRK
ncbi:MAG: PEP-CTERM sorting domain-containing protein [Armatimonadota bacterium]